MVRQAFLALFLFTSISSVANNLYPGYRSPHDITIVIDAKGFAYIGRDTLTIDKLAGEVQQRLWKSYMGTGRMYDHINIQMNGEVLMGVRGSAFDAIKQGQQKALTELCIMKYKNEYDKLSASQQRKLQKQFPVLFQPLA
jgi:hypothetical protein